MKTNKHPSFAEAFETVAKELIAKEADKQEDLIVLYRVTKEPDSKPIMANVINYIYAFVQNSASYFKYHPSFINGVLVFGVVGYEEVQIEMQKYLKENMKKEHCYIAWDLSEESIDD